MKRLALAALLALIAPSGAQTLSADLSAEAFTAPVKAETRAINFHAPAGGPLEFRGALAVSPPMPTFGGISAIAMERPGDVIAISDRGRWIRFSLQFKEGWLAGVDRVQIAQVVDGEGRRLQPVFRDSEGLARDPETGRLWVSYEARPRILGFDEAGGRATEAIQNPEWKKLQSEQGLEALAIAPDGKLWTIAEGPERDESFPVWAQTDNGWDRKSLPKLGPYLVTGAAFGPDGWLYVTERAFSYFGGFRFRLRRFQWGDGLAPTAEEELLDYGAATMIDNIEAIAIWREGERDYLLIASDDNFMPVQRNVLALFEIVE